MKRIPKSIFLVPQTCNWIFNTLEEAQEYVAERRWKRRPKIVQYVADAEYRVKQVVSVIRVKKVK